jgi:hypothetical protein
MKRKIWPLALLAISTAAQARFIQTKVAYVEAKESEDTMILLEDGKVLWLDGTDTATAEALRATKGTDLALDYDPVTHKFQGAQVVSEPVTEDAIEEYEDPTANYTPTVISSMGAAQDAFNSMDRRTKSESQCYNRAHGWVYDLWRTRSINSNKLFLFFTRKYIRAYRYHWWFHVTPMVHVQTSEGVMEKAMDRLFTRSPLSVRTWTNIFMRNDAECRSVNRYSAYRNNQQAEWCYLIRASMYYRTPNDLDLLERRGRTETRWVIPEIRSARQQAFIYWREYNP